MNASRNKTKTEIAKETALRRKRVKRLDHAEKRRKRAEKALEQSKQLYRRLVETMNEGLLQVDNDGVVQYANDRFCEMVGYSQDELLGAVAANILLVEEDRDVMREKDRRRLQVISERYEIRLKKKSGEMIWVSISAAPVTDADGNVIGSTGIHTDITERKQAESMKTVLFQISDAMSVSSNLEELLGIIRQKVGLLIDTSNFYVALYDSRTDLYSFPYCVDEHEETMEFAPQQLRKSLTDYVRRTGIPLLADEEVHHQLTQKGEVEMVGVPSAQWLGVPLKTAQSVVGVLVVQSYTNPALYSEKDLGLMTFASEQIALAIERKLSVEQLTTLSRAVEQSPVVVIITDTRGNIEYVNPKFTQISGYSSEEVVGKNPRILKSGETPPEEYQKLWETIAAGGEWRGEFHNRKKNGELYWESASISAVKNSAGVITHFLAIKEDITARKQAEEKRKQLEEQLHHAQKMETLGTLAGGIAHDFNNILQAIHGYVDMSLDEVPPKSQAHEDLQEVMKATNRGKEMVREIMTFSRREVDEPRPLRIHLVVREALTLLKASLPATIEVRQNLDSRCAAVMANPSQIHQVVMNLCTNAYQAMHQNGGVLTVSLEKVRSDDEFLHSHPKLNKPEYVQLTVCDTGEGMDQTTMQRVFEPFFTTKDVGEGTGLGLSVVHGIVMAHQGEIAVESEPGKGTTVRIYLPAIDKAAEQFLDKVQQIPAGHERILLVDDQEVVASVIKRLLQRSGYEVTTRKSSAETLATFKAYPDNFDLVITDQNLPQMTGTKLAGELLSIRPDLPIILMSGFAEDVTEESPNARGIKEFLLKPISADVLSKAIQRAMDEKQKKVAHIE